MPNADKDGTPKILIETSSLYGDKRVELVKVDSNRLDPIATVKQRMIEALIHPYIVDVYGDGLCWVSGSAFLASLARSTALLEYFQIPLIILAIVLAAGAFAALSIPEIAGAVILRSLFILIGFILGDLL